VQLHLGACGNFSDLIAIWRYDSKVIRMQPTLDGARGRRQDVAIRQARSKVAFRAAYKVSLIERTTDSAHLFADLLVGDFGHFWEVW
jgi:hypothetical protein